MTKILVYIWKSLYISGHLRPKEDGREEREKERKEGSVEVKTVKEVLRGRYKKKVKELVQSEGGCSSEPDTSLKHL